MAVLTSFGMQMLVNENMQSTNSCIGACQNGRLALHRAVLLSAARAVSEPSLPAQAQPVDTAALCLASHPAYASPYAKA